MNGLVMLSLLGAGVLLFPAAGAALAEPKSVITPVAEKKIAELPAGDLFRLVENFPPLASARAAEGADTPMQVFNAGDTGLDQIVMFVVDAGRPFSEPARLDQVEA